MSQRWRAVLLQPSFSVFRYIKIFCIINYFQVSRGWAQMLQEILTRLREVYNYCLYYGFQVCLTLQNRIMCVFFGGLFVCLNSRCTSYLFWFWYLLGFVAIVASFHSFEIDLKLCWVSDSDISFWSTALTETEKFSSLKLGFFQMKSILSVFLLALLKSIPQVFRPQRSLTFLDCLRNVLASYYLFAASTLKGCHSKIKLGVYRIWPEVGLSTSCRDFNLVPNYYVLNQKSLRKACCLMQFLDRCSMILKNSFNLTVLGRKKTHIDNT